MAVLLMLCAVSLAVVPFKKTTSEFPQAEYDQAYETLISEDYTQAAKQFARLSSKYPVYPEIWYQYGLCLMETGDYNSAIASFNKAAELYENAVMYDRL